ncbi:MAG: SRPBCC domain-containing protein [Phenylobacterium sp.]|uniref:SRPBCC family protein n=1 Tax=Phenylobacterium sp. TaxID=1871053 RepID=UPI001A4D39AA|nr:SRPBCC domain-containing protein [Phenylobacterium sp.]MBL8769812.1 SRPBCC domain-containing protein [Phenylobacterium sp.]
MRSGVLAAAVVLALAGAARAEVVEQLPGGFRLKSVVQIAAPPERVYQAIGQLGRWWDPQHSYSGRAENLSLDLRPGGCWCETLGGGDGVQHGVVVLAAPKLGMIRAHAALGPLQDEGVSAALLWQLKAKDGGTELTATYNVGGARDFIVKAAPVIDGVLSTNWGRLKRYVETGAP